MKSRGHPLLAIVARGECRGGGYGVDWDRMMVLGLAWCLGMWNRLLGCGRCNQGIRNEVCYFLLRWLQVSKVFILFLFGLVTLDILGDGVDLSSAMN